MKEAIQEDFWKSIWNNFIKNISLTLSVACKYYFSKKVIHSPKKDTVKTTERLYFIFLLWFFDYMKKNILNVNYWLLFLLSFSLFFPLFFLLFFFELLFSDIRSTSNLVKLCTKNIKLYRKLFLKIKPILQ